MSQHARRHLTRRTVLRRTAVGGLAIAGGAAVAGPLVAGADAATPGFGYRDDGRAYVVGTGADLVFKVDHRNGDLTSLVYRGTEYQGYGGRNSHVETGLGTSSVSIRKTGDTILVTVVHGTMHHYYAARRGENNVYMWTNKADASITATRYIVRVRPNLFPNHDPDSWDARTDTLIEAQDIRRKPNGTTRSKHYSNQRVIDYDHVGWSDGKVGMWMVRSNHEKASGGPFYRSLMRHHYEDGAGLYEILYYGENQTEPMRFGLQGPYVLAFTDGSAPSPALRHDRIDTSWADGLGLTGWVGRRGRGRVAGVGITGRDTTYAYTVGLAGAEAQYWTEADPATGRFISPYMLPGAYALTVYKEELAVYTTRVTVTAGRTTPLHTLRITADPSRNTAIWRIGDWSGTPRGFKNASLMTTMHPSDARARPWTGAAFTVGASRTDDFPCYQWADVNNRQTIRFRLTDRQLASGHTLNIAITTAFANGRPRVRVNDWVSAVPAPAKEPTTRSLTVGSYRGNNHTYSYAVPASAWIKSPDAYQELTLDIVSGSGGSAHLQPRGVVRRDRAPALSDTLRPEAGPPSPCSTTYQMPARSRTPKEYALLPKSASWGMLPALAGVVTVAAAVSGPVADAAGPTATSARHHAGTGKEATRTVTLVTGDRVTLHARTGGGTPAVSVLPGKGRDDVGFRVEHTRRAGTQHISVVPADAERLLSAGTLDARLFDVTELVRIGRDDARSPSLPLIVAERRGRAPTRSALTAHGAGLGRTLRALNGSALTQPKDGTGGLWHSLLKGGLSSRVSKLWLDGRAKVLDDESNKIVGAPTAWKSGINGKNVLIADLDTGIDATHPDFKGRIAATKDFTGTGMKDGYGHGTHTASTIAGTGAASHGRYAGVAPGAKLLVGKVCDDNGECPDSEIIAGMEWAAARHAVAVNLSLGDTTTDGTDPLSTALNRITAQTGTLFVVAAGNEGGPTGNGVDGTVESPGSAEAALTVGSSTKRDTLSDFSSQGPRLGDDAVKPDMVAPGEDIIGARADGTNLDTPVENPRYEQASGTSMATPHVTGAVALLAQAHPTWKAADFKRALTSSAHGLQKLTAFQQGSGRLDIVRALKQKVHATPGAANLGLFAWPHAGTTATRRITYRNDGDKPVTLKLALDAYGPGGKRAPDGMFSLGADSVTVPAHGTSTATVTGRTTKAQVGRFGGAVVATAGTTTVRTAVGLFAEPARHTLSLTGLNHEGKPAAGTLLTVFGPHTGIQQQVKLGTDGRFRLRLPEDDYDIVGIDDSLATPGSSGTTTGTRTLLTATGVHTDRDRTVLLDGRKARKVGARTDHRDATAVSTSATVVLDPARGDQTYALTAVAGRRATLYATPTAPATGHRVTFAASTTLTGQDAGHAYRYSLRATHRGGVPADTDPVVHDRQLATVHATYASQGGRRAVAVRADVPSTDESLAPFIPTLRTTLPSRVTEYYSPGLTWTHTLDLFGTTQSLPDGSLPDHDTTTAVRRYRPGHTYRIDWNRAPVGPAVHSATREGDDLHLDFAPYATAGAGQQLDESNATGVLDGQVVLSSGGRVIDRATPFLVDLTTPTAGKRRYALTAPTTRTADWTALGTRSSVTWGFTSARPRSSASSVLPLLTVHAGGAVDLTDSAPVGRAFRLPLAVRRPAGAERTPVTRLTLQVSYDDGRTWRTVHVTRRGATADALLHHPRHAGYASLRFAAADKAGNTVTQTVIRAYRIATAH